MAKVTKSCNKNVCNKNYVCFHGNRNIGMKHVVVMIQINFTDDKMFHV